MENALLIGLSRQMVMSRQMSTIANNIANMNTPSYKAENMLFEEYVMKNATEQSPDKTLSFVQDYGQTRDMSDGSLETTGNPLDIAITGQGFFKVQTPGGTQYTRNGHMQLDDQGQLVNSNGDPILSDAGSPITFATDEKSITIARDGTITTSAGTRGKLAVVSFDNMQAMKNEGQSMMSTTQAEIPATGVRLIQGAVEGSNVKPILEMTNMIEVQRSYERARKLIETADDMRARAISTLGQAA
ncbi:MAG: flagellar basal-body rod protein FlgF [Rhizobiales bacterium]|nr:flagellar basal-body rod protein FlgF [Hyphomicrobiales bacterium]